MSRTLVLAFRCRSFSLAKRPNGNHPALDQAPTVMVSHSFLPARLCRFSVTVLRPKLNMRSTATDKTACAKKLEVSSRARVRARARAREKEECERGKSSRATGMGVRGGGGKEGETRACCQLDWGGPGTGVPVTGTRSRYRGPIPVQSPFGARKFPVSGDERGSFCRRSGLGAFSLAAASRSTALHSITLSRAVLKRLEGFCRRSNQVVASHLLFPPASPSPSLSALLSCFVNIQPATNSPPQGPHAARNLAASIRSPTPSSSLSS